jgi:hypothetical protein
MFTFSSVLLSAIGYKIVETQAKTTNSQLPS